jgi:hypothetical protein
MNRCRLLSFCGLSFFLLAMGCAQPARSQTAAVPDRARAERIESKLVEKTQEVERHLAKDPGPVEIREVTNGALVEAFTGNYAKAEQVYRIAFDEQNMMPGEHYGEMPWKVKDRKIKDANSIDFATESMGVLLKVYYPHFSAGFQKYLRDHAQASLVALQKHKVAVSYSNIYTMNFSNIILIAEALHDDAAAQYGYGRMDAWLDYTGRAGLHEFDSPTYNSVVLSALMMAYQYSESPHVHQRSAAALKYVWTDLAANYFAAARKMAGAKSRDYNFVYGTGGIDAYYFWQQFQDDFNGGLPLERAFLLEATKADAYYSDVKPFPADVPRFITQRYDEGEGKYRITYVTPQFALGVANGNYEAQDKMFAFDFATPKKGEGLPNTYLAITATGRPYGQDKSLDKSGHSKPHHLKTNLGAIQDKGFALLVAEPDARNDDTGSSTLYVDMVLPNAGELTLDGKKLSPGSHMDVKLASGQTFGLRVGSGCFAVRPFTAKDSAAADVGLHLISDSESEDNHAFRLSAPVSAAHPVGIGYLVNAEPCGGKDNPAEADLKAATLKESTKGKVWTVEAALPATVPQHPGALALDYDLGKFASTGARVNGAAFSTPPLKIDLLRGEGNQASQPAPVP